MNCYLDLKDELELSWINFDCLKMRSSFQFFENIFQLDKDSPGIAIKTIWVKTNRVNISKIMFNLRIVRNVVERNRDVIGP